MIATLPVIAAALALAAPPGVAVPQLQARGLPSYAEVSKRMPEIWKARYPVEVQKFTADPSKRGVLRAVHQGRYVYYYHFQATVLRPVRGDGDGASIGGSSTDNAEAGADNGMEGIAPRTVEFWARYRSWLAEPWDLSFVRQDRLPGTNRRWIKVR